MKSPVTESRDNQHGFAVVYGLMVLFIASLTGVSLITISQKDKINTINYSKMRNATVASHAALRAVEHQCRSQPNVIIDILNSYLSDNRKKWLLGNAQNSTIENHILIDPDNNQSASFSARILHFDPENKILEIEGIGYSSMGGKKCSIGIYHLSGISPPPDSRMFTLYVNGNARSFDAKADISGDVYFGGAVNFNGGANGSIFRGNVKTRASNSLTSFNGSIIFNGNVFFQTPVQIQAKITFNGHAGFSKDVRLDACTPDAFKDIFLNSTTSGNMKFDMNGAIAYHSGQALLQHVNGSLISNGGPIDISSKLQISEDAEDPPYSVDISVIPVVSILNSSVNIPINFKTSDLQNLYDLKKAQNALWNDFLVLKVDNSLSILPDTTIFTGNIIWIVEKTISCNMNWYTSNSSSVSLIYVKSGGTINEFGSKGYLRGYVYVEGNGSIIYKWNAGGKMHGAIHHVDSTCGWQVNSGSSFDISLDYGLFDELSSVGILKKNNLKNGSSNTIYLSDVVIRPKLVGIYR